MTRQLRSTFFQEPTTVYIKQLQMIGMPSFPFGSMPLFPLWCSGNACRGWTLLATLPRVVTRKLCFTICADCGDAFAFYLCRLGSQDCTGELGAPQPQMASAPVGDEAICQTFLCAVGKSASRQSASQSCTRAGTCNVDHDPFTHTAAATSDATKSNDRPSKYVWAFPESMYAAILSPKSSWPARMPP